MRIYIGNLPWSINDSSLKELFKEYDPEDVAVITDKLTKKSKGFGFVTINNEEQAKEAIKEFNGKIVEGRKLKVSKAVSKKQPSL